MKTIYIIGGIVILLFLVSLKNRPNHTPGQKNIRPSKGRGTMEQVHRLIDQGHKLQAIKLYREIHNVGLKEAKEAVDKMAAQK